MRSTAINLGALALAAMVLEQVMHEATHGVVALLVGGQWTLFHLFAVQTELPDDAFAHLAEPASAALLNIAVGLLAASLVGRVRAPHARAFVVYFAAFSLMAGFGYLFFDAALFRGDGAQVGDWRKVIALFDGDLGVRIAVGGIGGAGYLAAFFWTPRALRRLTAPSLDDRRYRLAAALIPFVVTNAFFTALAPTHPLAGAGLFLVASKGWLGFSGLFWATFILRRRPTAEDAVSLPDTVSAAALVPGALAIAVALVLAFGA